jgi:hypothetical protein
MEISNNLLTALVVVAMAISIAGTMNTFSMLQGGSGPITGFQTLAQSGTANASLSSETHIQLIVSLVNFGSIAKGQQRNTTAFNPHPFVLRNNGSTIINVSIGEAVEGAGSGPLWVDDNISESSFRYNSTQNGTYGAVGTSGGYTNWRNFDGNAEAASAGALSTTIANLAWNLTAVSAGNARDVTIHLDITPPSGELAGYKEATVYFLAAQA